eukprot:TRINITY_DN8031_c0_g1_i1.p1 TRINITY_DN8031_c0_g1~~TRINITY_DN8031_c0_g1_i1.p1  ORF type:complete len:342 (-),score=73.09 TRINITY_DN8031_c0_g1_i1:566-1591(-)
MKNERKPRVIVGVTGSVATVKLIPLLHALHAFAEVKVVTTKLAQTFFEKDKIDVPILTDEDEWQSWKSLADSVLHIELRKWADLIIIAPLSANTLAKLANGLCDNLLTCVARAWDNQKPFIVAPAMNTHMWSHPLTSRHLREIGELGISVINPISKKLACGDTGLGAMAEVQTIVTEVKKELSKSFAIAPDSAAGSDDAKSYNRKFSTLKELVVSSQGTAQKRTAVILPDTDLHISYEQLITQIEHITHLLLKSGVTKGEVVAVILPNGLPFLVSFLAVTWARAVAAPLNSGYKTDEFLFYLEDIKAKIVIIPPGPSHAKEAAEKLKIPMWEIECDEKKIL